MKVAINACFGGFSLSEEAVALGRAISGNPQWAKHCGHLEEDAWRADPTLIAVIEQLGPRANGECAKLKIVEVPGHIEWAIDEYDGFEKVIHAEVWA